MGTYKKEIKLGQPIDVVSMVMEDYLFHNRFRRSDWEGEMVFASGDGEPGTKYLKWNYVGGVLHLEAWVKGYGDRALGLSGFMYSGARSSFQASLSKLERDIKTHCTHVAAGHVGADPLQHTVHKDVSEEAKYKNSVGYDYSHKKSSREMSQAGKQGLFLAIFSLFFAQIPVFGVILAVIAMGRMKNEENVVVKLVANFIGLVTIIINLFVIFNMVVLLVALK